MCESLVPVSGTIWEGWRGLALLEKCGLVGGEVSPSVALRFSKSVPGPVSTYNFRLRRKLSAIAPVPHLTACHQVPHHNDHGLWNCKYTPSEMLPKLPWCFITAIWSWLRKSLRAVSTPAQSLNLFIWEYRHNLWYKEDTSKHKMTSDIPSLFTSCSSVSDWPAFFLETGSHYVALGGLELTI